MHCVTTVAPAGRKYPHLSELYTPFLLIPVLPFTTSMTLKNYASSCSVANLGHRCCFGEIPSILENTDLVIGVEMIYFDLFRDELSSKMHEIISFIGI